MDTLSYITVPFYRYIYAPLISFIIATQLMYSIPLLHPTVTNNDFKYFLKIKPTNLYSAKTEGYKQKHTLLPKSSYYIYFFSYMCD